MSQGGTPTHLPPLGGHVRDEVGRLMQETLVELIDLALVGKQLHWCVTGPLFRPLHMHLDELVDEWHELSDTVAERAVAIGSFPDGQAETVAERGGLPGVEVGALEDTAVVRILARSLAVTVERTWTRMDRLGELDLASQDVLIEVVRGLEKQLWMVRAQFGG